MAEPRKQRISTTVPPFLSNPPKTGPVRVLVVDDEAAVRTALVRFLRSSDFEAFEAYDGEAALERLKEGDIDVLLADLMMPVMDGMQLLREVRQRHLDVAVVIMTGFADATRHEDALKAGAFNFLKKPFASADDVVRPVRAAAEHRRAFERETRIAPKLSGLGPLIGSSSAMQSVYRHIRAAAASQSSVLILGDSGTGKELVAQQIHQLSRRAANRYVAVNCGAFAAGTIECELFGSIRGAFTGALDRPGLFETAKGGTVFLDEVGELSLELQPKLLRVLESREITRMGESIVRKVDFRLVAATNRDLLQAVEKRTFRDDLYFRLNVVPISLPPLRDRMEDVNDIASHLVAVVCREQDHAPCEMSKAFVRVLRSYPWPGNIRELKNIIERAVIRAPGSLLTPDLILEITRSDDPPSEPPPETRQTPPPPDQRPSGRVQITSFSGQGYNDARQTALEHFENAYVRWALGEANGVMARAAKLAGVDRPNFKRIVRRVVARVSPGTAPSEAWWITQDDDDPA